MKNGEHVRSRYVARRNYCTSHKRMEGLTEMDVKGIGNQMTNNIRMESINHENDVVNESVLKAKKEISLQSDCNSKEDSLFSEKEQQQRMNRLQETLKNHNIEISYNEDVNRYSIKVLDADSKEVIKEIPSEKTLEMFARMLEIEGLLVDEKR